MLIALLSFIIMYYYHLFIILCTPLTVNISIIIIH